jgi:indolepyruvate ferredoxin oxidoreductase beta subunit
MNEIMNEIGKVPHHIALDADATAKETGSVKAANIVILGAATPFLGMDYGKIEDAIRFIFRKKGDKIIELNLNALKAGSDFANKHM